MIRRLLALCLAAAATLPAVAQSFPERPVKIVVAFAPGTGSDVTARLFANAMGPVLGGSVIVDNRAGGGGIVGTDAVAKSPPDGYTLALGTTSTLVTNPAINPEVRYNVERDFAPVAGLAKAWYVLFVANTPEAPKSIPELIERLKAKPGTFSSSGAGTITHLASEMFLHRVGIKNATHVPYKGSSQAIADVAGGQVLFGSDTLAAALPLIRGGKLRALMVTAPERVTAVPDVPTAKELGYADLRAHAWLVLMAPAGTPAPVVAKLSDAVQKSLNSPELKEKLKAQELEELRLDAKALGAFIKQEMPYWSEFIKQSGVKVGG